MTNRKSNASDPFAVALRLLTGRDRSCFELRKRLKDRDFDQAAVDATIQRCLDYGYLNDQRFAYGKARALISSGKAVGRRAEFEMKKFGLDSGLTEQALATAADEIDLDDLLDDLFQRRYPDYCDAQADTRMRQRITGYFQRRGFPLALILDRVKRSDDR